MDPVERSGKTVEDVLKELSREWECLPEDIEYELVQEGSRGVMGIGSKNCVIRASPPKVGATLPPREPKKVDSRPRPKDKAKANKKERPPSHPQSAQAMEIEEEEGDNVGNLKSPAERARAARPARPRESDPEVLERARKLLEELIHFLIPEATALVSPDQEGTLDIQGETGGLLIGRRGQTLDALQFLLNKMVYRQDVGSSPRIQIDVAGYRERRAEALENLAFRMAAKARQQGRAVRLEPMAPHERRIIHMALEAEQGVHTESEGQGEHKRVVIKLDRPTRQGGRGPRGERGRGGRRGGRGREGGRGRGPGERGSGGRPAPPPGLPQEEQHEPGSVREDAWRERVAGPQGAPGPQGEHSPDDTDSE